MSSYIPSQSQRRGAITFTDSVKYSFNTTWFDKVADKDREYVVTIYRDTKEVEIVDVVRKNMFLRRTPYPELDMSKFYIGNAVVIHGRQHNIVGFANEFTRNALSQFEESTLGIIMPSAYGANPQILSRIIEKLQQNGLQITRLQTSNLDYNEVGNIFGSNAPSDQVNALTEGTIVFMEIRGADAYIKWINIMKSLGNGLLGPNSKDDAARALEAAFQARPTCAPPNARTAVLVIEPTFKDQYCDIISFILKKINDYPGVSISGIHSADPVAVDIDELFKAYQGVIPNWRQYCDAFDDGMCIAFELVGGEDVIASARHLCGPFDPEIARVLNPNSLRARFGKDVVQNAIFVTDIPEEAEIHSDFWFRTIE